MKKLISCLLMLALMLAIVASPVVAAEAKGNGSFASPVSMNQKHTWTEVKDYLGDTISVDYSLTVKKVSKISVSELNKLGFKEAKSSSKYEIEYALIDLALEIKNATIKKVKGKGTISLSSYAPSIWGIKTKDGISSLMGIQTTGFDGSLGRVITNNAKSKKVTPGIKESLKADGKILVILLKGKTNYLGLRNYGIKDYNKSFIYFNLTGSSANTSNNNTNNNGNTGNDKPANNTETPSASGNGSFSSPIPLNKTHSWTETRESLGDTISATYSLTVKNVKIITIDELNALGLKAGKSDGKYEYEYALIDVAYEIKDATITKVKGEGSMYLSSYSPYLWGLRTKDDIKGLMSITDYGFEGSISRAKSDVTKGKKVTPGVKESYKVEGQIVMVLLKGKTNYLVARNQGVKDYDSSFIYFKLD